MKLGILGSGMIVRMFLSTIHDLGFEEISILGRIQSKDRVEAFARENKFDKIFYDYDKMLEEDIDIIYNALPNHLHYEYSKKAIQKGKHVMIEKPITANLKELEELIALAKEYEVMIFEAMTLHTMPVYQGLKDALSLVGDIKIVNFNYSQYSSRYNAFKEGNILPAFDYHKAGGALYDLNVYNVHGILGLFGAPKNVIYQANVEKGIDTSGILIYDYDGFKAVSIGAKDCKAPLNTTIQGNNGVIIIDQPIGAMTHFKFVDNANNVQEFDYSDMKPRMYYEFAEFIREIKENDFKEEYLQISYDACKLMNEARVQAGIVFDNDLD